MSADTTAPDAEDPAAAKAAMDENWQKQLAAVGLIATRSAVMDSQLAMLFCGLVESKYAAVIANGQSTSWLIEHCRALLPAHVELSPDAKAQIKAALDACQAAAARRNDAVHSMYGRGTVDDHVFAVKAKRRGFMPTVNRRTLADLDEVAKAIYDAYQAVMFIFAETLWHAAGYGQQLLMEQGQRQKGRPASHARR